MIPNVVWMLVPTSDQSEQASVPIFLTIVENAGRVAVLILPFFFSLDVNKKFSTLALAGIGLALAIYYVSWIRYFVGGRSAEPFVVFDGFLVDVGSVDHVWYRTYLGFSSESLIREGRLADSSRMVLCGIKHLRGYLASGVFDLKKER
jgi:hypothetical protein